MPNWRTWSFLAKQIFLIKSIKKLKVVYSSKWSFTKNFLWSREFCFWHPCWKLLSQIRKFFILNQKKCQTFFLKKNTFVSNNFSGRMECGVDNSAKNVSPRNRQLLADCPKVKKFWFLPKLFPRSASLRWTRRKPSWLVQFFFWSFCGREGCRLDTAGEFFSWEHGSFSLKFRKSIKSAIFFEKKFNLIQKLLWWHGMQFWQLCQFCSARNPKDFRSVPKG